MWLIKTLSFLWPFIKEMVFGNKTVAESVRANKIKSLFFFVAVLSLVLNLILFQRLIVIGKDHIDFVKEMKKKEGCTIPITPPVIPEKEIPKQPSVTVLKKETTLKGHEKHNSFNRTYEEFTRIKEREERE